MPLFTAQPTPEPAIVRAADPDPNAAILSRNRDGSFTLTFPNDSAQEQLAAENQISSAVEAKLSASPIGPTISRLDTELNQKRLSQDPSGVTSANQLAGALLLSSTHFGEESERQVVLSRASAAIDAGLAINPKDHSAQHLKAVLLLSEGKTPEAISTLEALCKEISKKPESSDDAESLMLLAHLPQKDDPKRYMEITLEKQKLFPKSEHWALDMSDQSAIEKLLLRENALAGSRVLDSATSFAERKGIWGLLSEPHQIDALVSRFQARTAEDPKSLPLALGKAEGLTTLGEIAFELMKDKRGFDPRGAQIIQTQAPQAIEAVLKLDPKNWEGQLLKGQNLVHSPPVFGGPQKAVPLLEGLIKEQAGMAQAPEFISTHLLLIEAHLSSGSDIKAKAAHAAASALFPDASDLKDIALNRKW